MRTALLGLAVLALLGGCLGVPTGVADPSATSAASPVPSPGTTTPACSNATAAVATGIDDVDLPTRTAGFRIAANRSEVRRGDVIRFSLRNVASESRATGPSRMYLLQRRDAGGWRTVLRWGKNHGWNATAVLHDPGEGFGWTFAASARGFSTNGYVVCRPLPPGEYRFVYVGIVGSGTDSFVGPAVAVRFRLRSNRQPPAPAGTRLHRRGSAIPMPRR